MGKPKHGKDKWCAKYKAEGRREKHKEAKAIKVMDGKRIKSRRIKKTWLMKWNDLIRNTPINNSCIDFDNVHHNTKNNTKKVKKEKVE